MSSRSAGSSGNREAKLEMIRRQNAADARRRRIITLVTVGIIAVLAGVVGVVIWQAAQDEAQQAGADPGNLTPVAYTNPDGGEGEVEGFAVGPEDAAATVTLYEDYICPACQAFEQELGTYIDELPAQGVRVVYHPVAILDRASQGTEYSTRSASAAACVAEDDDDDLTAFKGFSDLLFLNQPAEGSQGLESTQLAEYAVQAGAPESARSCIEDDQYAGWAARATDEAQAAGLDATPFLTVNGVPLPRDQYSQQGIQAAIDAAGGGSGADPSDAASEPAVTSSDADPSAPAS